LGIVEDWDVVFPPVALLVAVDVLFPDVAFCANVDGALKFSAAITVTTITAAAIRLPNLRDLSIMFLTRSILFIDCYYDIYNRNIKLLNIASFISYIKRDFSMDSFSALLKISSISNSHS
jgi:hypothetical protein